MRLPFALLAASVALPAVAQEEQSLLSFVVADETLRSGSADYAEVISVPDEARHVVLLEMEEALAADFAELTGASVGETMTVLLCGEPLFEPVVQARIDGGRVILPVPNASFGDRTAAILRGEAACDSILADEG